MVLQPMTELGIIIPGYDDPDELGELMDSEKSHVSVQNIMAPTAESEFVAPSLLPSWLTQLIFQQVGAAIGQDMPTCGQD